MHRQLRFGGMTPTGEVCADLPRPSWSWQPLSRPQLRTPLRRDRLPLPPEPFTPRLRSFAASWRSTPPPRIPRRWRRATSARAIGALPSCAGRATAGGRAAAATRQATSAGRRSPASSGSSGPRPTAAQTKTGPEANSGQNDNGTELNDELLGLHGNDRLSGGFGRDILWGDQLPVGNNTWQHDIMDGGPGNDWIYSSHGHNDIDGGAGNDHIWGHYGHGTIDCGPGWDVVHTKHHSTYKLRHCERHLTH